MEVLSVFACICVLIATISGQDPVPDGQLVGILEQLEKAVAEGLDELEASLEGENLEGRRKADQLLSLLQGSRRFDIENMLTLLLKVLEATGKSPPAASSAGDKPGGNGGASPGKPGGKGPPGKKGGKRNLGGRRFSVPDWFGDGLDTMLNLLGLGGFPPDLRNFDWGTILSGLRSAVQTFKNGFEVYNSLSPGRRQLEDGQSELIPILEELEQAVEQGLEELASDPQGRRQADAPEGESHLSQVLENLGEAVQKGLEGMLQVPEIGEEVEEKLEELEANPELGGFQGRRFLQAAQGARRFLVKKLWEIGKIGDIAKAGFDALFHSKRKGHRRSVDELNNRRFFLDKFGDLAKGGLKALLGGEDSGEETAEPDQTIHVTHENSAKETPGQQPSRPKYQSQQAHGNKESSQKGSSHRMRRDTRQIDENTDGVIPDTPSTKRQIDENTDEVIPSLDKPSPKERRDTRQYNGDGDVPPYRRQDSGDGEIQAHRRQDNGDGEIQVHGRQDSGGGEIQAHRRQDNGGGEIQAHRRQYMGGPPQLWGQYSYPSPVELFPNQKRHTQSLVPLLTYLLSLHDTAYHPELGTTNGIQQQTSNYHNIHNVLSRSPLRYNNVLSLHRYNVRQNVDEKAKGLEIDVTL